MINEDDGIKIVEFGYGSVEIMSSYSNIVEKSITALSFAQCSPRPIGSTIENAERKTDKELGAQIRFVFHKSESINVLINDLVKLKECMTGDNFYHKPSYELGIKDSAVEVVKLLEED